MIYLGEQIEARDNFFKRVNCWVKIKLLGKRSSTNPGGHKCTVDDCPVCLINFEKFPHPQNFADYLIPRLEDIIKAKPVDMIELETAFFQDWTGEGLGTTAQLSTLLKSFLKKSGYTGWFTGYSINYELAEWLDRHTCTYCNRQYIFTSRKKAGKKGINCQFDHWFNKADHPLFALSFYNLIPSCAVCNGSVKASSGFCTSTHLHPYLDNDIASSFIFSYKKVGTDKNQIVISNKDKLDVKTIRTLDDLGTELVYANHSSKELQDLIDLRLKYSENYLEILLNKTFGNLEMNPEEKYRLIFGIELEEKDFHRRPMSKFKKDIITELMAVNQT